MDAIISQIVSQWGVFGLLLIGIGYIIWDNWRINKSKRNDNNMIMSTMNNIGGKINILQEKINIVDDKVVELKSQVDNRIDLIEQKVDQLPISNLQHIDVVNAEKHKIHLKQMDDLMKLGPKLHRIIQVANNNIGSDHIFVGSFHNGNSSLSGIPYYKFDIIAERFAPTKISRDCEFAHMYKDSDILRYDTLPSLLVQQGLIHFVVPSEGDIELSNYDDIIWRRMRGRGIKQIAIRLTRDSNGSPSGFVGVVKYDMNKLNLNYLDECGRELEEIYKDAESKELSSQK